MKIKLHCVISSYNIIFSEKCNMFKNASILLIELSDISIKEYLAA